MSKDTKKNNHTPKPHYKITNWPAYNQALKQRAKISLWLPADVDQLWYESTTPSPIGQFTYSPMTIEFCLTMRQLFHLPYRQTQGFVEDLLAYLNLRLSVPCYSQLQRRAKSLAITTTPAGASPASQFHIVIDSTGLKVAGEGEWQVRQHGKAQHRQWLKLTLISQPQGLQILAHELTQNHVDDAQAAQSALLKLQGVVLSCGADGAYDKTKFRACLSPQTRQLIPPARNAVLSGGNPVLAQRDEAIRQMQASSRSQWKQQVGYHQRSKAEVNMFRYKSAFGERIRGRKLVNQQTEVALNCKLLNRFAQLGLPQSRLISP